MTHIIDMLFYMQTHGTCTDDAVGIIATNLEGAGETSKLTVVS